MATTSRNFKTTSQKVDGNSDERLGFVTWFFGSGYHARNNVACLSILIGTIVGLSMLAYCVVTDKIIAIQAFSSLLSLFGGFVVGFLYGTTRRE